jgi:hypothetical protein
MREFLSKSIAGGLSAGVVLLWWPILFDDVDTVTSWLARGVAWTVCFEVLLLAFMPFERALWETTHGERISTRVGAAGSRLHAGSRRKRMGRLSLVATTALAIPVALLVMGLHEHAPARAEAKVVRPVKVVRVTKVVKVERVVERAPISGQPITTTPTTVEPQPASPAPTRAAPKKTDAPVGRSAPVQRESAPRGESELTEETPRACEGDACGSAVSPAPPPSF